MTYNFKTQRFFSLIIIVLLALGIFLFGSVEAAVFKYGKNIEISKLHQIDNDFYAYSQKLIIDGNIRGDVHAFVNETIIRGNLENSVNIATYKFTHKGIINGSLRLFAQEVEINGHIGRSAMIFGQTISLTQGSMVQKDVDIFGQTVGLEGTIAGNAKIIADTINISGIIEGDLNIEARKITITPPTVVKGNFTYTSENEVIIDTAAGVTVIGTTTWNLPEKKEDQMGISLTGILIRISCMLATFIFALVAIRLFRPYARESFYQLKNRFASSFAAGVLGVLILIVCFLILLVSVLLFLAGVILISSDYFPLGSIILVVFTLLIPVTSFISVSGGVIFYSGKIIVAALIGYILTHNLRSKQNELSSSSILLGLTILLILFTIPYVGFYIYLLTGIAGAGAILMGVKKCTRQKELESAPPDSPTETPPSLNPNQ